MMRMIVASMVFACMLFCASAQTPWAVSSFADEGSSSAVSSSSSASASAQTSQASQASAANMATDPFKYAAKADMSDGLYLIDVTLAGGSGKASVESPAELEVFDGRAVVQLVWSSEHYDYMIVNGEKYLPVNKSGNSTFAIPVLAFDESFDIIADTTAMGTPHEISYTLTVKLDSVKERGASQLEADTKAQQEAEENRWPWIVFAICAVLSVTCIGAIIVLLRRYRN